MPRFRNPGDEQLDFPVGALSNSIATMLAYVKHYKAEPSLESLGEDEVDPRCHSISSAAKFESTIGLYDSAVRETDVVLPGGDFAFMWLQITVSELAVFLVGLSSKFVLVIDDALEEIIG